MFNSSADISDQLSLLKQKFRARIWTLSELKRHSFTEKELLKAYTTMLRPVVEYSSVIYHPMLSAKQANDLERLQACALKNVFGYVYSYRKLLELSGLQSLQDRRIQSCRKFAQKTANNSRFSAWFPKRRTGGRRRTDLEYVEQNARTDRRKNSPLFYYRRLLNERVEYTD